MTLRKYFKKAQELKNLSNVSAEEIALEVESVEFHTQDVIKDERFIPQVDFSDPANFARYGSAEEYYEQSIKRIYNTYPYDGSLREKLEWENESSYIDLYIFDNRYPRTNGYAIFSADANQAGSDPTSTNGYGLPTTKEYIYFKGGPNTNPDGMSPYSIQFTGSNYYHTASNRESNLKFDLANKGVSIEFWLKKDGWAVDSTEKEVIFDLWNSGSAAKTGYGRLRLELSGASALGVDPFRLTALSGTGPGIDPVGFVRSSIASSAVTTGSVADGNWHHYAVTLKSASAGVTTRFYIDGALDKESTLGSVGINEVTGAMQAYIGALVTSPSGSSAVAGAGKLSGSLDEFRYWKTQRTSKDIGKYWFTQVGGGTNSDPEPGITATNLINTTLGVYYKFNEGITDVASTDSTVLDYSGRVTNGTWTGYTSNSRNLGSAIVSASAATKEFKDPIIYSTHPSVVSLESELAGSGSWHDTNNNASLYGSMPGWITEEDELGSKDLKYLTQIMGSYLDTLQLQIEALSKLKDVKYPSGSNKPLTFANRLLEANGLIAPEMFLDADVLEKLADRSEKRLYEKTLTDIKNTIYQNVYNNLSYIYKSKGTEKSFRNLIRCYGIDDELIKFNLYANNIEYELLDNVTSHVIAKRFVDFNTTSSAGATVYQTGSAIAGSTYLTGGFAFTTEANVIFPIKAKRSDTNFISNEFITSSIFGLHGTLSHPGTHSTAWGNDEVNFQVCAIRDELGSPNVRFKLTGTAGGFVPELTSSLYEDVYDNTNWTLAVRIKPEKYPYAGLVVDPSTGSAGFGNYIVELHGINVQDGAVSNEFNVSGTITTPNAAFITGSRRLYAGTHRTNFTGSIREYSDIKVGSVRHWLNYLEDTTLMAHAKDIQNYGTLHATRYPYQFMPSASFGELTSLDTLALNWDFNQITSSNASGEFTVRDYSSGSVRLARGTVADASGSWISSILTGSYSGQGYGFLANDIKTIDKDYITATRQNLPENLKSQDMIEIYDSEERDLFVRNIRPTNFSFAFEKSMYQIISEEMLRYFGTIRDLHNLIGEPVNRYRMNYKMMEKARQAFFEKVQNTTIDFDKFYEYYKWFDSSLSIILMQLVPASADVAENIRTMIESHVLERNKYQSRFPTAEYKDPLGGPNSSQMTTLLAGPAIPTVQQGGGGSGTPLGSSAPTLRQIGSSADHLYGGWVFNHAPLPASPPKLCENRDWWKKLASKLEVTFGGATQFNINLNALTNQLHDDECVSPFFEKTDENCLYLIPRSQAPALKLSVTLGSTFRSHDNYHSSKRSSIVFNTAAPHGPLRTPNLPTNVALALPEDREQLMDICDEIYPNIKQRLGFKLDSIINKPGGDDYLTADGNITAPFSLYSSSVTTGHNALVVERFAPGVEVTNLHNDGYGIKPETPLQGPFTEAWVGGRAYRHVDINRSSSAKSGPDGLDSPADRAEGFKLLLGRPEIGRYAHASGALGVVDPQYPDPDSPSVSPPYLFDRPKGNMTRDLITKRPVNIRNILSTTSSTVLGNYSKNYQVIQTAARSSNDPFFNDQSFSFALNPETLATRGRFPLTSSTANTSGSLDYELPARTGSASNKTVIVNRFSAPGSYEVMSRGYMDPAHEEKSVYNALPFRNLTVRGSGSGETGSIHAHGHLDYRRGLRTLLTLHAGPFGTDAQYGSVSSSAYNTVPSYHKVNRNRRYRFELSGTLSNQIATGSQYDNWWVQHPIPRAARGYRWIAESLPSGSDFFTYGGLISGSFASSLPVISASEFASIDPAADGRGFGADPGASTAGALGTPFNGMNTNVREPRTCHQNFLGFYAGYNAGSGKNNNSTKDIQAIGYYINIGNEGSRYFGVVASPMASGALIVRATTTGEVSAFNAVMLHRNGPWGYPTWKQIRGGEHPVVRSQRSINIISQRDYESQFIYYGNGWQTTVHGVKGNTFTSYIEQPLSSRHKPLSLAYGTAPTVLARVSWANNLDYFSNEKLNNRLGIVKEAITSTPCNILFELVLNKPDSALEYTERIYPRETSAYQNRFRSRTLYTSQMGLASNYTSRPQIWNSSRAIRSVSSSALTYQNTTVTRNSQGNAILNASSWPLDGPANNTGRSSLTGSGPTTTATGYSLVTNDFAGELLNNYCRFGGPVSGTILPAALYASLIPVGSSSLSGSPMYYGGAPFIVASQMGQEPYRSYEEHMQYVRLVGKDHSIVPEFRISRFIESYIERNNSNWLADIDGPAAGSTATAGMLDITGAAINNSYDLGSKVCEVADTDEFYKVYGTDFWKYFKIVDGDLSEKATSTGTTLKKKLLLECSALVKPLFYKGFYPVERTVELATLFSRSYGLQVSSSTPAAYRALIEPLFAPGILYNTIKSGIAVGNYVVVNSDFVDFNTDGTTLDLTGSAAINQGWGQALSSSLTSLQGEFNGNAASSIDFGPASILSASTPRVAGQYGLQRIPFEALMHPQNYLSTGGSTWPAGGYISGSHIFDSGLSSASLAAAGGPGYGHWAHRCSWDGSGKNLYNMAVDNFLCETVNFFLKKDSVERPFGLTTIKGEKEEAEWQPVKEGKAYAMTVHMKRPLHPDTGYPDLTTFTMFNRGSAFGYPVALNQGAKGSDYNRVSASFAHVTPGYFNGACSVTMGFVADRTGQYNFDEIKENLSFEYTRDLENRTRYSEDPGGEGSDQYTVESPGYWFAQQISESVDLFEKVNNNGTYCMLQSKFETPVLNFAPDSLSGRATYDYSPAQGNDHRGVGESAAVSSIGVWLQSGSVPSEASKGITISITTPESITIDGTKYRGDNCKSLASIVGLDNSVGKDVPIGVVANEQILEEAVVVVPFTVAEGKRKFFEAPTEAMPCPPGYVRIGGECIPDTPAGGGLGNVGNTVQVGRQQQLLRKYVFPPKFETEAPLFFAFEFDYTLSKDDLVKLYQNVMFPSDFDQAKTGELACEKKSSQICSCCIEDEKLINQIYGCIDELKWLVFKVKKRAKRNYDILRREGIDSPGELARRRSNRSTTPTYNWPYDYFSLVELIKIDATARYYSKEAEEAMPCPPGYVRIGGECIPETPAGGGLGNVVSDTPVVGDFGNITTAGGGASSVLPIDPGIPVAGTTKTMVPANFIIRKLPDY